MSSSYLKQSITAFLVLVFIAIGLGIESYGLLATTAFEPVDLKARYFGPLVGLYYGVLAALAFALISRIFNLWQSETEINRQGYDVSHPDANAALEFSLWRGVGKLLVYVPLFSFGLASCGLWQGSVIDLQYYQAFAEIEQTAAQSSEKSAVKPETPPVQTNQTEVDAAKPAAGTTINPVSRAQTLIPIFGILYGIALACFVVVWQPKWTLRSLRTVGMSLGVVAVLAASTWLVFHKTDVLTRPNLALQPQNPREGIYVYANDVCCDLQPLNIYSSRMGGFMHSGICFLTQDPGRVNRVRKLNNLPELKFHGLNRNYYFCDLNMELMDRDGLSNHGAGAKLSNAPFPFDKKGLNHYLAGRSVNDRLHPAIRLRELPIINPLAEWDKVIAFEDKFNAMFSEGILYSPVPYKGKFAPFYNCNTLIAGIVEVLLEKGSVSNSLTDVPWSIGGQTGEQGRQALEEIVKPDFPDKLTKQRDFMKNAPANQQPFWHQILHRDRWLYKQIGSLDSDRYEQTVPKE